MHSFTSPLYQNEFVIRYRVLKRVSQAMGIPTLTGHVPRHTLASHMAYMGNSEEDIRQVFGHVNLRTTKIYLRERHWFSGSFDIMKRFHQVRK